MHNAALNERVGSRGLVVFDGSCGACTTFVGDRAAFFERHGFTVAPLQERWVQELLGLDEATLAEAIHLRRSNGEIVRGLDFFLEVMRVVWWLRPLEVVLGNRLIKPIAARVYQEVAKRRRGFSAACGLQSRARYK